MAAILFSMISNIIKFQFIEKQQETIDKLFSVFDKLRIINCTS